VAGLLAIGLDFGLSAGPAHAATDGFSEEEVRFKSAGATLEGTILVPEGEGRKPAIALVQGSGPHTREDYRAEAEAFARGGIVTLIYNKRTKGYSGFERSYELLASDALAAVNALQDLPYVDRDAVGLWGLSEGSWVVPLAASRSDEVGFVVLVAATGVPPAQQTSWALETALRHQGVSGSMIKALSRTWIRLLVDADMFAEANYDPVPVLERVDRPVLALWGEKDRVEPLAESARILRQALQRGGNTLYTLRFFPNAEHGLPSSPDGFVIREHLAPGYPETVTSWVKDVARGEAPGPSASAAGPIFSSHHAAGVVGVGVGAARSYGAVRARLRDLPRGRARSPVASAPARSGTIIGAAGTTLGTPALRNRSCDRARLRRVLQLPHVHRGERGRAGGLEQTASLALAPGARINDRRVHHGAGRVVVVCPQDGERGRKSADRHPACRRRGVRSVGGVLGVAHAVDLGEHNKVGILPQEVTRQARLRTTSNHREQECR
jgi:dienelactone hydrolase